MAKVTYYDLERAASSVDFMGHAFNHNEPVEIDHTDPRNDALLAKLAVNPFFKVEGLPSPEELEKEREKRGGGPGRPKKVAIENASKAEAARKAAVDKLRKERADAQAKAKSDAEHDAAEARYRAEMALLKAGQPTLADLSEPAPAAPAKPAPSAPAVAVAPAAPPLTSS
jgi:hypothetical protein